MTLIIDFYQNKPTDCLYKLEDIWSWRSDKLESAHDYIQYLFPTDQASNFNINAPLVTEVDKLEFKRNDDLRNRLLKSFHVFLEFLGLKHENNKVTVLKLNNQAISSNPDHNWLRITRILRSLKLLGLEKEAKQFYNCLKELREAGNFSNNSMMHFTKAIND